MRVALATLLLCLSLVPMTARAETVLLMAEEVGCMWCARWNSEISHIYPKTPEGRTAPLQRFDLKTGTPPGITLKTKVRFTPTFILVRDGVEEGRIEGYPGEDFFWGLLARLFERADIDPEQTGS